MAGVEKGASIELLTVGSVSEAYAIGEYWSKKLACGAKVRGINLKMVTKGWKVIIKYEPREAAR